MTIIDQRILIPAGPDAVWEHISNIANNPNWQVDCKSISFLSSRRQGAGVRWRYSSASGREYVLETTAWYDGLGYEYTYIDGAPFRESRGRIRLQEIPEGTIVQWTLNYELPGVFAGLRNLISVRRPQEAVMIDSLKTLWRKVTENRGEREVRKAKSLMRDALDYEERMRYKPRHTPNASISIKPENNVEAELERFKPASPPQPEPESVEHIIPEPPILDEDTRPSATIRPAELEPDTPNTATENQVVEPDFLRDMPEESPSTATELASDTAPITPITQTPPSEAKLSEPSDSVPESAPAPVPNEPTPQPEHAEPSPSIRTSETRPVEPAQEPPPVRIEDDYSRFKPPPIPTFDTVEDKAEVMSTAPASEQQALTPAAELEPEPQPEPVDLLSDNVTAPASLTQDAATPSAETADTAPSKTDTDEVSIWDVFGIPRPSETQEIAAVKIPVAEEPESATHDTPAPIQPGTSPETIRQKYPFGLRITLRRKLIHLRRYR
jgi:uncharacterized membrane protein